MDVNMYVLIGMIAHELGIRNGQHVGSDFEYSLSDTEKFERYAYAFIAAIHNHERPANYKELSAEVKRFVSAKWNRHKFKTRLPVMLPPAPVKAKYKVPEKVVVAGVTREAGWLYFINKDGNIARSRLVRGGALPKSTEKAEVVAHTWAKRDINYIYFMDDDGDVARVPRSRGGTIRDKKKKARL